MPAGLATAIEPAAPMPTPRDDVASYLNASTSFKGLLKSQRSVGIDGRFEGEIHSDADIVIGREAEVKANIQATNVIVSGKVMGNITCGTLEIQATGRVVGNIAAGSLLIAMGAMFRGQSTMGEEPETGEEPTRTASNSNGARDESAADNMGAVLDGDSVQLDDEADGE
ncbi:MAG: bactofilin family protein [Chloroflexota bacterium]